MNGIRLPENLLHDPTRINVFELRKEIYKTLQSRMKSYVDDLYSVCDKEKQKEINDRKAENSPFMNSLLMMYKGIEFPIFDKNNMILDGIPYIPTLQIVDKPIHSQKNGKFIIVKTNMRYSYIKMQGTDSMVLTKTGAAPLLVYMLYFYNNDVMNMLVDLGYDITSNKNEAAYFIPDYGNLNRDAVIMVKECQQNHWKHYFLSPFSIDNLEFHQELIDSSVEEMKKYKIDPNEETTNETINDDGSQDDIDDYFHTNDEMSKLEKMKNEKLTPFEKMLCDRIAIIILCYYMKTKRGRKNVTKTHITNTLQKLVTPDMTLNDISILGLIKDCVINDVQLPDPTDIGDLSQKMIRFMEWYALKLISVRSFPEKAMIVEVAKTEQKLVYNNTCNALSELAVMTRSNLFGKGGLPRESCQSAVRNLHDSYYGVIDSIDSPSGANIGISLHVVPEVSTFDLEEAIAQKDKSNIFNV